MAFLKTKETAGKSVARGVAILSVIAQDTNILGALISDGSIDFDGTIDGNIRCHTLTIRKNGNVKGDVNAQILHVYGKMNGVINAKNVHLYADCYVEGVVIHENLSIETGAFLDGKCKRMDKLGNSNTNEMDSLITDINTPSTIRLIN